MAEETIIDIFWHRVAHTPDRISFLHKINGSYVSVGWKESGSVVQRLSAALLEQGIEMEDTVSIVSASRAEWTWADLSILSAAAVTVPIYPSLNAQEAEYVLAHSGSKAAFLENSRQLKKLASLPVLPPSLRFVVIMDSRGPAEPGSGGAGAGINEANDPFPIPIYTWEQFLEIGARKLENSPDCVRQRRDGIKASELATIVYTSGTTGVPKGAMISHRNILYVCRSLSTCVGFHPDDLGLSFLPLSHIFERVGGQFLSIHEGIPLAYAESMDTVAENIAEVKPTIMNAVPRFYEKAYNRIQSQIRKLPTPQQYFARWALSIGRRALKAEEEQNNGHRELARQIYRTELRVADRFVFRKIRQRFGGRLRFLVSGAAPLSPEVHQFFGSIGIPILEGYGLTETTAPIACNRPESNRRGTVGKPLPGVEIQIAADGEILVRGPNVFSGYYKNEEASKSAFIDGWFMTGDIGEFDRDGFLCIKDRKKDIIITAGGKHVAPQVLENMLAGQGLISRVLVYGDRRKYISALVTLSPDELKLFATQNGISYSSLEELTQNPKVYESVQTQINEANARLASFEQIKRFRVLDCDFSIETNELTPTMKVKRKFVTEKYRDLLDGLYEKEDILA